MKLGKVRFEGLNDLTSSSVRVTEWCEIENIPKRLKGVKEVVQ